MGPNRSLAYWLALVDRLVEERFSAALEEHGVTRLQWRIRWVLSGDGRFTLTERGQSAHDGLAEVVTELRVTLVADVSEADQDQAAATLERMARNLGWDG